LQEDIIRSVLNGHDTLALLPTGGGKSLCYQVPGMAREGLCIVVSPLIALMKDQLQNLKSRGIKAVGVYHGMSRMEIETAFENCAFGDVKFLYLSPERLTTDMFRGRLPRMKVNLLAVDEAHCISQWGYDFRPPYLKIAEIRELLPQIPILALTATATRQVVEDIQQKLAFNNSKVFQKSFERKNLAYVVLNEEDKLNRLLKICNKVKGPGIVYVRNRKKTRELANFLRKNKVSADFYHAGLTTLERDLKQSAWMKEKSRVMVSTNAFGMGIDKPNVRFVVHMDLPDSPEAYFQEAGRGGRDGKKSFAVLLFNKSDVIELEHHHELSYPPIEFIKKVYNSLGNFLQMAVGSGREQTLPFSLTEFAENYNYNPVLVFNSLQFLEREGYIAISDALANPSKIFLSVNKEDLYRFQVATPALDAFIKVLLRSYSGLFTEFVKISEGDIAKRTDLTVEEVKKRLFWLKKVNLIQYEPQNEKASITFIEERLTEGDLRISPEVYHARKKFSHDRVEAMKSYVTTSNRCRSMMLLAYFGEITSHRCGQCDVCLERNKAGVSAYDFDLVVKEVKPLLLNSELTAKELLNILPASLTEEKVLKVLKWLIDSGKIVALEEGQKLKWSEKVND
jgi:ATP-dependent DNA helicase RecQ